MKNTQSSARKSALSLIAGGVFALAAVPALAAYSSWDENWIQKAARDNHVQIEAARLATEKATKPELRAYGEQVIAERTKVNSDLGEIISRKGMAMDDKLDHGQRKELDKLRQLSGTQFDREYVYFAGLKGTRASAKLYDSGASHLYDVELKTYAQNSMQSMNNNIEAARRLP